MKFLTLQDVIDIHDELINVYGGLQGIRDRGLLLSAIEMPKAAIYQEELHPSIFDKAAAYTFHIIGNHPFIDGNKRTCAAAALIFLEINKTDLDFKEKDFEDLIVQTAEGKVDKKQLSFFFQKHSQT